MIPNVTEIRKLIKVRGNWSDRARNIEIIHTHFMLTKKKWSLRKSAKYLNLCASTVCEDLKLARYMVQDPSIERFKSRKDAMECVR
jgi:hypothetical protein